MYAEGDGVQQNCGMALGLISKAAKTGLALAQGGFGAMYYKGICVARNYKTAVVWLRKAVDQGDIIAGGVLGNMYFNGQGVSQDYATARTLFQKVVDYDFPADDPMATRFRPIKPAAEFFLGQIYERGLGVPIDIARARDWYQKAAAQGLAPAEDSLGLMYSKGVGVVRDYSLAAAWYRKAADRGDALGQLRLGAMYALGRGVKKDLALAIELLRKSSKQGNAQAPYFVGIIYENGNDEPGAEFPKDVGQALKWYRLAAVRGNEDAKKKLAQLQGPLPEPGQSSTGTINLQCRSPRGTFLVSIDMGAKRVTMRSGSVLEYGDDRDHYVNITSHSIDFGCRKSVDESKLAGEIAGNLFNNGGPARAAQISKEATCLNKFSIDRTTGILTAVSAGPVTGGTETADCVLVSSRQKF